MKSKGFVLMETIVVIVVISVALLTIFSSYNKILRKLKTENKYDTSEYIYMTNYIKEYLQDNTKCNPPLSAHDISLLDSYLDVNTNDYKDHIEKNSCGIETDLTNSGFLVKKIYILSNINKFDKTLSNSNKNSEYFDAYMIDYIRKLDVGEKDELIIVEYERPALKSNGDVKKDSLGNILNETYIASLEW